MYTCIYVTSPIELITASHNSFYRLNVLPIKAIAFDVWNTLLSIDKVFSQIAYIASNMLNIDVENVIKTIEKVYRATKILRRYSDLDGFQIVVESQKILAKELNTDVDTVIKIIDEVFSSIDTNSLLFNDVKDTLKILKRLGFKMGIIGNVLFWSSIYTRKILKELGILSCMNVVVFSDELRINKPDRRIFLHFSREIGVEPEYIAYVGDSVIEDVGGALSAGMKAIHLDRSRVEKNILKDIGIAAITNLLEIIDVIDVL